MSQGNLIPAGHDWSVSGTNPNSKQSFDLMVAKGLPSEVMIQVTYPGAINLGLTLNPNKETPDRPTDPAKSGFKIYTGVNGIRLDRFMGELEANGLRYERGRTFKKIGRRDHTMSLRFSRLISQPAHMPENVRELLSVMGFDGLWLYANELETGTRRDCIVCQASRSPIIYGRQLAFDGETKGNYMLHKVIPTHKDE